MSPPNSDPGPQRPGPPVDTLWFDVSALLLLPPGYMSGIPRTIRRVFHLWRHRPWTRTRFCAVVPDVGLAEVDLAAAIPDASSPASGSAAGGSPGRRGSRFWYLPYGFRHQVRTAEKGVRDYWAEPARPAPAGDPAGGLPPYPPGCPLRPLADLGPRDLVFSLGGLWLVPDAGATLTRAKARHGFRLATLVYDLIPIHSPHLCDPALVRDAFRPCTDAQLAASDVVLTISAHSRADILRYAEASYLPAAPVEVFTLGSDGPPADPAGPAAAGHPRPFVLTVGSVEVRKNHYGMYQAWRRLVRELGPDRTPDLVVAGSPGWQGDQILYLMRHDPLVRDKIVVKPGASDRELDWLYRNCLFTLYPSLYEGWGLPVEESLARGKLCVTTTASSLPEVGREFADYVEPEDADAIARAVVRGLDDDYRRGREAAIRERFRANTWEQASRQLQAILRSHYRLPSRGAAIGPSPGTVSPLRRIGRTAARCATALFPGVG